jgi:hypothetical protein
VTGELPSLECPGRHTKHLRINARVSFRPISPRRSAVYRAYLQVVEGKRANIARENGGTSMLFICIMGLGFVALIIAPLAARERPVAERDFFRKSAPLSGIMS